MKILVASTPATGHVNPILAIVRILRAEGHDVVMLSGTSFRSRIVKAGAEFRPLPPNADFDSDDLFAAAPELRTVEPGPEWFRIALERLFVERIPDQFSAVLTILQDFPADLIIGDDMFFGLMPLLMGPRDRRPPIILCGTSFLHWEREDRAPHFIGLPPARTSAEVEDYARIAEEQNKLIHRPVGLALNRVLKQVGVGPQSMTLFDSVVKLADTYLQLTVPSFEFPRAIPPSVRFIGRLPIIPDQAPLPSWAGELDGTRKVVLVTQGTVANHDFDLLVGPTLAALADEPDILVVVTTGGRPIDTVPGPIPANARLAAYLPFEWLLTKVDLMVTNGGYGSVNQALSFGIPIVAAGLTEDKADVNARIAWSGAGIDLKTNNPTPAALRAAVRAALDEPTYRNRAHRLASEYSCYDAYSEIQRLLEAHERSARNQRRGAAA